GSARLQRRGPAFSMLALAPLIHPRASPVVLAIAREMLHIERSETPDGAPAVPYLVFLVRPDGIRPYYEARARLEPLGIAFGYELIEQDLAVEIPHFDDLPAWGGTMPLDPTAGAGGPLAARADRDGRSGRSGARPSEDGSPGTWPPSEAGGGGAAEAGSWSGDRPRRGMGGAIPGGIGGLARNRP